ncbi:MAG: magnesium/cobalt transporter CorA [Planctomycetota bacterium]|jgi:magnesium transporter
MPRPSNRRSQRTALFRRQTQAGAVPGTIDTDPEAQRPIISVFSYGPQEAIEEPVPGASRLKPFLGRREITWINVIGLGDAETVHIIGSEFRLHALALEDVVNVHQQPKVELYGDRVFLVLRIPRAGSPASTEQISVFAGPGFVITFQEAAGDCFDPVRERIRSNRGRIRSSKTDYLTYALLDACVDAWFPVLEDLSIQFDEMDALITAGHSGKVISRIHAARQELNTVRRVMLRQREAIGSMIREDDGFDFFEDETRLYLRDCQDHTHQLLDAVESLRETSADLREFHYSLAAERSNETAQFLTIIATIFIPLSFIAGLYGMNFNPHVSPWNMPELNWLYGYPFALMLMLVVACLMLFYFWTKGWFGPRE